MATYRQNQGGIQRMPLMYPLNVVDLQPSPLRQPPKQPYLKRRSGVLPYGHMEVSRSKFRSSSSSSKLNTVSPVNNVAFPPSRTPRNSSTSPLRVSKSSQGFKNPLNRELRFAAMNRMKDTSVMSEAFTRIFPSCGERGAQVLRSIPPTSFEVAKQIDSMPISELLSESRYDEKPRGKKLYNGEAVLQRRPSSTEAIGGEIYLDNFNLLSFPSDGENVPPQHTAENMPLQHTAENMPLQHTAESVPPQHTAESVPLIHKPTDAFFNDATQTHLYFDSFSPHHGAARLSRSVGVGGSPIEGSLSKPLPYRALGSTFVKQAAKFDTPRQILSKIQSTADSSSRWTNPSLYHKDIYRQPASAAYCNPNDVQYPLQASNYTPPMDTAISLQQRQPVRRLRRISRSLSPRFPNSASSYVHRNGIKQTQQTLPPALLNSLTKPLQSLFCFSKKPTHTTKIEKARKRRSTVGQGMGYGSSQLPSSRQAFDAQPPLSVSRSQDASLAPQRYPAAKNEHSRQVYHSIAGQLRQPVSNGRTMHVTTGHQRPPLAFAPSTKRFFGLYSILRKLLVAGMVFFFLVVLAFRILMFVRDTRGEIMDRDI